MPWLCYLCGFRAPEPTSLLSLVEGLEYYTAYHCCVPKNSLRWSSSSCPVEKLTCWTLSMITSQYLKEFKQLFSKTKNTRELEDFSISWFSFHSSRGPEPLYLTSLKVGLGALEFYKCTHRSMKYPNRICHFTKWTEVRAGILLMLLKYGFS